MSSGSGSSALVYIKVIQWCGNKVRVVRKVPGEDIDYIINRRDKVFDQIRHVRLVGGNRNLEFLTELR